MLVPSYCTVLTLLSLCHAIGLTRTFYITPSDSSSQLSCPVDHCYSLQDVINNQSNFVDSYMTLILKLMPGRYDITERVGHLVIAGINNFILKGVRIYGRGNAKARIICHGNATFGFALAYNTGISIVNFEINSCCANLNWSVYTRRKDRHWLDNFSHIWFEYPSFCMSQSQLCCISLFSMQNNMVTLHRTNIIKSSGIGMFSLGNTIVNLTESLMEYNQINCIIYMSNGMQVTVSDSHFMFGNHTVFQLASGLSVFMKSDYNSDILSVALMNVTFKNNCAHYGNLYLTLYAHIASKAVYILIQNVSVLQNGEVAPGLVMEYYIDTAVLNSHYPFNTYDAVLRLPYEHDIESIPIVQSGPFDHDDHVAISTFLHAVPSQEFESYYERFSRQNRLQVKILIGNIYLEGCCVIIKEREPLNTTIFKVKFYMIMKSIIISKSQCSIAFVNNHTDVGYLQLRNLTITNSFVDILYVRGNSDHTLEFTDCTSITMSQGSILFTKIKTKLSGEVQISNNVASNHESIFLISDSSEVSFLGITTFIDNRGRKGGAISIYGSNMLFSSAVIFTGNLADTSGGAISLNEG